MFMRTPEQNGVLVAKVVIPDSLDAPDDEERSQAEAVFLLSVYHYFSRAVHDHSIVWCIEFAHTA